MTIKIEDATREEVAKFLPSALQKAFFSYELFMEENDASTSTKNFLAHHSACKVAIAHIELLIKLARWADVKIDDQKEILSALNEAAMKEANAFFAKEVPEGGDDFQ